MISYMKSLCHSSRYVEKYSLMSNGATFCAGGPVWGLDWCPLPEEQITSELHDQISKHPTRCINVIGRPTVEKVPLTKQSTAIDISCLSALCPTSILHLRSGRSGRGILPVAYRSGRSPAGASSGTTVAAMRRMTLRWTTGKIRPAQIALPFLQSARPREPDARWYFVPKEDQ